MREFEVLGEAIKHVLTHEPFNNHVNPEWREIVDFRNIVAHEYFGVDYDEIFQITQHDLLVFEAEFLEFIKKMQNEQLHSAINHVKRELSALRRKESLLYLKEIEMLLAKKR